MHPVTNLLKTTSQLRLASRHMSVVSGPPRVKVSPAEKAAHGMIIALGILFIPAWVVGNINNYKKKE